MKLTLVLGLMLSFTAAVGDRPIPQDAARMEKRDRERLEWHRKTLQGVYDKVGKKDPRWDKPAREALDLAARMFSQQLDPAVLSADVHAAAKKAVDAGCGDPMIQYLYVRTSLGEEGANRRDYKLRLQNAAEAMEASACSPYRRAVAIEVAITGKAWNAAVTPEERRERQRKLDTVLELLPRSLAEDPRNDEWEVVWYREINSLIAAHRQLGGDYQAAFDRVDARLAKIPEIQALRLAVKGNFLINSGWETRTAQVAAKVTEDQFRVFGRDSRRPAMSSTRRGRSIRTSPTSLS